MRKTLLLSLLLFALPAIAQVSSPGVIYVTTAPSGACVEAPPIQVVRTTGVAYTCNNGTWGPVAGGGSTAPGGLDTQVQFNHPLGTFAGNSALTFTPSTAALTIGSPTPSILGTNSGPLTWTAPYDTGSGTALDTYQAYIQIGSGVNPFSNLVFNHSSGSTGGGEIEMAVRTFFTQGAVVQGGNLEVDSLTANAGVVCTNGSSQLSTSGCSGGGGGTGITTPLAFGGFGDALQIPNGCTTNGTTTIVCPAGPFVSGDVGKELWVSGAGAAGVAFGANITVVSSNTTVTVASTPSTTVTQNPSVFGHDDVVAIQDCINASSLQGQQCFLGTANPNLFATASGWLVASAGLLIPTHSNIAGSSMYGGSSILSEFNGDLFSLTQGTSSLYAGQPVSGVTISNLGIYHDASQPAGRTFHINSAAGIFGFGGMYYSTFTNIDSENAALECLWLDGHTNSTNNPNQYLTFNNLVCDGPNQMHTANEIKITGIQAQIQFMNGAINGITQSNYPNPLIYVGEKTTGQGDSPGAVSFFNYTYEVGTQGLFVGNGSVNIHYDNGYVEQVESPLIVSGSVQGLTYRGNHLANSGNIGAIAQFSTSSLITATLQDNQAEGSSPSPAAFASCTGSTNNFAIDFLNNISPVSSTSNCVTNHIGTGAALFQPTGTTATVDPSSQAINLIEDPNVAPGKTLTLYALSGGVGSFSLASGGTQTGNEYPINLGSFSSPLIVTAGNSVVLALLDQGSFQWTVVSGTNLPSVGIANATTTVGTTTINANTCTSTTTVSMPGVITTSSFTFTPNADVSAIAGWGSTGGLVVDPWPTAGNLNYKVCNSSGSNITPGSSVTFNVGAK